MRDPVAKGSEGTLAVEYKLRCIQRYVCTALISLCTTSKRIVDKGTFVLTRDPVTKGSEGTLAVEYKLV